MKIRGLFTSGRSGKRMELSMTPDFQEPQDVSEAVVRTIADAEGISPLDVQPPLATVIDPDALDQVVASMTRWSDEPAGVVEFPYNGYIVSVTGGGVVSVSELDAWD